MRIPSHWVAASLPVLVSVLLVLAPCQVRAFPDDDVWVTSGIIAGITLGACVVVVLLAGLLTDLKGETDPLGADWPGAMETALERLPLDLSCPGLVGASQGFCPTLDRIQAIEANRRADQPEEPLRRNGLEVAPPFLRTGDLAGAALLTRSLEDPPPMPHVIWERSPSHGGDEARSGRLF